MTAGDLPPNTNVYRNAVVGATPNPLIAVPDADDERFASAANGVLRDAVELARALIGAHQAAAAIIVQGDWASMRKFFSLSEKYAAWATYAAPATGYGIHGWLLEENRPARLTQTELESHPQWRDFGNQAGQHPPMRGWLAVPLVDRAGTNWGLLQLSDKYAGDFTADDEARLVTFARLVSAALEALWNVRELSRSPRS